MYILIYISTIRVCVLWYGKLSRFWLSAPALALTRGLLRGSRTPYVGLVERVRLERLAGDQRHTDTDLPRFARRLPVCVLVHLGERQAVCVFVCTIEYASTGETKEVDMARIVKSRAEEERR